MYRIIFLASIVAIISGCASSLAPSLEKVPEFSHSFDLSNGLANGGDPDQAVIDKILSVSSKKTVYIDWEFYFGQVDGFSCSNGVLTPNEVAEAPSSVEISFAEYQLPVFNYSTHFLMSVFVGSPVQYPFNAVSCYQSGSELSISIQGYYSAIRYLVPTAQALQLRPVSPSQNTRANPVNQLLLPPHHRSIVQMGIDCYATPNRAIGSECASNPRKN